MAVFETWTVLPHKPLRKHSPRFWSVQGTMPTPRIRRVMSIAQRGDGRLVIHNAIALDEPEMKEIEALGEPAILIVPNQYHRQDAKIWKQRYPNMKVYCPDAAKKGVAKVVAIDGSYADYPADDRVVLEHAEGCKGKEGIMVVKDEGTSLVFNDIVANQPPLGGPIGFMFSPTGRPSVPRVSRWLFVSDKRALVAHLERYRTPDLRNLVVSHGKAIEEGAADALKAIGDELVG